MKGYLMQLQPFSVNDGDGIRTTIFLQAVLYIANGVLILKGLRNSLK